MKYLIILLFLFSCTSKIKVKRVIDGDTIVTAQNERIRLAEIDAPELHQDYGIQAKQFLSSLVLNKTIEVKRTGKDRYGRTIARLYSNGLYIITEWHPDLNQHRISEATEMSKKIIAAYTFLTK